MRTPIGYSYCSLRLSRVLWRGRGAILLSYEPHGCVLPEFRPTQFAMFWVPGLEAIPLAPIYASRDRIDFLVRLRGSTTKSIIEDPPRRAGVIGPMGRSFTPSARSMLLVAGGTGVASLIPLAAWAAREGTRVVLVYGARTESELAPIEQYLGDDVELVVATDDGSKGLRGTAVDVARAAGLEDFDIIVAAGPPAMICGVYKLVGSQGLLNKFYASLETIVRCGMGFCGSCMLPCTSSLLCREGPVFPGTVLGCWVEEECSLA
ncbi:iron-sulfur cluster-binding protein [Pyrodictium delaneyi]|uniref:Dihydroorotate dehydrogenase electron transfer subunit iron-sulphur cluster binding domain-containing protein n=1 Tax=Pyrodictium delaneyi TaxID=1273541 RepID=A0A211YMG7_9CREN|nr:hypothetical protein [Pyrodictium delaneyi]OWJ54149.1 hypothetical protein Pdsh_09895 [Pyrodictium delaneyi]